MDYLKYDWCSPSGSINDQVATFAKMRDALAATGRPIVYSINSNSVHAKTGPQRNWGDVANLWRTTEDIQLAWDTGQSNGYPMGVRNIVDVNVPLAGYAGPGQFNDPDMMEVGRGTLSDTEQRSHFALWAMMAAPLIAGNDVRSMSAATQTILKNAELIAINQDTLALQATQVSNDGTRRVLAKRLSNGDVAVALFNQAARPRRSPPRRPRSASPAVPSPCARPGPAPPPPAPGRSTPPCPGTAPSCSGSAAAPARPPPAVRPW